MKNTPIERSLIDQTIQEFGIVDFSKATIREVKAIAAKAEAASGVEFIKMEMGVPGLPPSAVGVQAEIKALTNGIGSLYPDINGLPALKEAASRFIKAFINVEVPAEGCVQQALCRAPLPLSLPAANVRNNGTPFYSSTPDSRYKNNSW